jgi:hypothetical protein
MHHLCRTLDSPVGIVSYARAAAGASLCTEWCSNEDIPEAFSTSCAREFSWLFPWTISMNLFAFAPFHSATRSLSGFHHAASASRDRLIISPSGPPFR